MNQDQRTSRWATSQELRVQHLVQDNILQGSMDSGRPKSQRKCKNGVSLLVVLS